MRIKPNTFTDLRGLSKRQRQDVMAKILWDVCGWRRRAHLRTGSVHAIAFKHYCDGVVDGKHNLDPGDFLRLLSACDNERQCAAMVWRAPLLAALSFFLGWYFSY